MLLWFSLKPAAPAVVNPGAHAIRASAAPAAALARRVEVLVNGAMHSRSLEGTPGASVVSIHYDSPTAWREKPWQSRAALGDLQLLLSNTIRSPTLIAAAVAVVQKRDDGLGGEPSWVQLQVTSNAFVLYLIIFLSQVEL